MTKRTLFHCTPFLNIMSIYEKGLVSNKKDKSCNFQGINNNVLYATTDFSDMVYNWVSEIKSTQENGQYILVFVFEVEDNYLKPDPNVPQPDWEESVIISTDVPPKDLKVVFNKLDLYYETPDLAFYEQIPLEQFLMSDRVNLCKN